MTYTPTPVHKHRSVSTKLWPDALLLFTAARALLKPTRMMAKSEARIERRAAHLGAHAESMAQMANNAKLASSEQKQLVKQGEELTMNAAAAVAQLSLARDEDWSQVDSSTDEQVFRLWVPRPLEFSFLIYPSPLFHTHSHTKVPVFSVCLSLCFFLCVCV